MLVIGYGVVILTVLSISAISTSATVEGGGVYCILATCTKYTYGKLICLCVCGPICVSRPLLGRC